MKKIDIEKIPRDNIYSQPKDAFETLQKKVLTSVKEQENAKITMLPTARPRKSYWSVAAAVVIILGLSVFFTFSEKESDTEKALITQSHKNTTNSNEKIKENPANANALPPTELITTDVHNSLTINDKNKQLKKVTSTQTIVHTEQVINILPAEDLTMLTQNIESDLYLDLYQ